MDKRILHLLLILSGIICTTVCYSSQMVGNLQHRGVRDSLEILKRYISVDNVCAWPNLTTLKNGNRVATIFGKPSHGAMEGGVECWVSTDNGKFWEKAGTSTPNKPGTNRMNVAAGLANNGDLIVIASGWSLKPAHDQQRLSLVSVLRPWVSRSGDGGQTWDINESGFPVANEGFTENIPFGDILKAADGSLRVLAYNQSNDKAINTVSMFRSTDDGKTWKWLSNISNGKGVAEAAGGHNETAFFHTGSGKWVAAARRWKGGQAMDLFSSEDDGKTWKLISPLTDANQHPGHITRLNNGELLLTYGNRKPGQFGVAVKRSKDNGRTWNEEQLILSDLSTSDSGYPSSVQLDDGTIMTVYYSIGTASHQRYHMGTVIWRFQ